MIVLNSFDEDLNYFEEIYNQFGFEIKNLKKKSESQEYHACTFELNQFKIVYRKAKITPTKVGQFVTIWKRNLEGITEPFSFEDDFDFMIITTKSNNNFGQFIFPKSVLAQKKIVTKNTIEGKRGFRVYTTWDLVINNQAKKTQDWQKNYFVNLNKKLIEVENVLFNMLSK